MLDHHNDRATADPSTCLVFESYPTARVSLPFCLAYKNVIKAYYHQTAPPQELPEGGYL